MEYYRILDVSSTATSAEIKKAYRHLVKLYHPDLNPSEDAANRILEIREAYDVLSNPYQRNLYDLSLNQGIRYEEMVRHETVRDEREERKKAYFRKKAREEREKYERLLHIKAIFYQFQRKVSFLLLLMGIVFTIDYAYQSDSITIQIDTVTSTLNKNSRVRLTNSKLLYTYSESFKVNYNPGVKTMIRRSAIFKIPAYVEHGSGRYKIMGTLFSFHNFFAYTLIFISALLLYERKYSDFRMTIGILSWFFALISVALLLEESSGSGF